LLAYFLLHAEAAVPAAMILLQSPMEAAHLLQPIIGHVRQTVAFGPFSSSLTAQAGIRKAVHLHGNKQVAEMFKLKMQGASIILPI